MGNSIQIIADNVSVIASAKTWIEGGAIQQLQTTAKLKGMARVVGMPDLHPGRGYPVGAAFFSRERFYPALIGGDIGCGMRLSCTDLVASKISLDKLQKRFGNIDAPLSQHSEYWRQRVADCGLADTGYEHALGTIGGGNHFAEIQQIDKVLDQEIFDGLAINQSRLLLLVHSGSRGFGGQILRQHIEQHQHHGLNEDDQASVAYLRLHSQALSFARMNRQLIEERIVQNLGTESRAILDVDHNLLARAELDGQKGWLHRKGATPSDQGVVIIPGSRGDYSYLVAPIPSATSLYSLAHGAGRKWMRSECETRLSKRYTTTQLERTALGSRVICKDKHLIFEEAPEAYKSIDSVIGSLQDAGLITLVARLKPILSYKTSGGCCE